MARVVQKNQVDLNKTQVIEVKSKPVSQKRRRSKAKHLDASFLIIIFSLLAFGYIMVFSAGHAEALNKYGDSLHYIKRHSLYMALGVSIMLFLSSIDYHIYRYFVNYIMGIAMSLLVLVLIIGSDQGTFAKRWIGIGELTFQPSEIMKFALITFFAHLITVNYKKMHTFRYGVAPFGIILAIICFLMYLQPHMSGMIIICAIGVIMMFVGGTSIKYFLGLGGIAVVGVVIVLTVLAQTDGYAYIMERINMWLDPFADPTNSGWQTTNSLIAIGSGGLMGRGIGMSRQKYMYIPHPHNDFIFAIICEELGLVGAMIVILLFIGFTVRGFTIATKAPDKFGYLMAVGLIIQITLQAVLNIGVVTNTFPNTGISLPFFSYGGTALIMQLAQMGILLNISRHSVIKKAE